MFDDLALRPALFLSIWAAGLCGATAAVARWRVAGPGFLWTATGATFLVGLGAVFAGPFAIVGIAVLVMAATMARRPRAASWLLAVAALAFGFQSGPNVALAITGALALGGVSSEMLLGHWYLIDPSLPRASLRKLAGAGMVGIGADALLLTALGAPFGSGVLGVAYVGLAALGTLLMVGVWFSINEKGYEGVMAATGLSYLAVLTVLGSVALGRALI